MRSCGPCSLCCTVLLVPEIRKPPRVRCEHCGAGCSIYKDRPNSCRDFSCEWLKGFGEDDMRPDKSHVVLERLPGVPIVMASVDPGYAVAAALEALTPALSEYTDDGIAVVASDGGALIPTGMSTEEVRDHVHSASETMGLA